jgi:hypothetical protein
MALLADVLNNLEYGSGPVLPTSILNLRESKRLNIYITKNKIKNI